MDGIEKEIKNLIETLYCCKYTRPLKVTKHDGLYKCTLYLHDEHFGGLVMAKQCESDEEFLDFIKTELRTRRLDRSQHAVLKYYGNYETQEGLGLVSC